MSQFNSELFWHRGNVCGSMEGFRLGRTKDIFEVLIVRLK